MRKQQLLQLALPLILCLILDCSGSIAQPSSSSQPNARFNNLIARIIDEFQGLAHSHNRRQFAVIMLLTPEQVNQWNNYDRVQFQPGISASGHPDIDWDRTISPPLGGQYGNFIVALPTPNDSLGRNIHSEELIIAGLEDFVNQFRRQNQQIGAVVIYSRICPCRLCTDCIINSITNLSLTGVTQIVYTTSQTRNVNVDYSSRQFRNAGINFRHYDGGCGRSQQGSRHKRTHDLTCSATESLQYYLMVNLKNILGSCITTIDKEKATVHFINLVFSQCRTQPDLVTCSQSIVSNMLGSAPACNSLVNAGDQFAQKMRQAMSKDEHALYVITQPLDPNNPWATTEVASNAEALFYDRSIEYSCSDSRKESTLCSTWKADYVTAGNSICRRNHPCDYYKYQYKWCYLEYTKDYSWEYCCTGECQTTGNYWWCKSGNTWEYCGRYGTTRRELLYYNRNGHRCRENYPCGKHRWYAYNYYCYDSNGNWDYCCAPNSPCTSSSCYVGEYQQYYSKSCKD